MNEELFWLKLMYFFRKPSMRVGGVMKIDGVLRYCEWYEEVPAW